MSKERETPMTHDAKTLEETMSCREALQLLLDHIDFRKGACSLTDMVGQCIPPEVFKHCDRALSAKPGAGEGER